MSRMEEEEDAMSDNSIPFGYGASAYGSEPDEEDADFVFHRPISLQHMAWASSTERHDVERAASPAPSYQSMESDCWDDDESEMRDDKQSSTTRIILNRQDSSDSCSSFSSHGSSNREDRKKKTQKKKTENSAASSSETGPSDEPDEEPHPALNVEFTFKVLTSCLKKLSQTEFKHFKKVLWEHYPKHFRDQLETLDLINFVDKMLERCELLVALKITREVLNSMNLKHLVEHLQGMCIRSKVRYELKKTLKKKYDHVIQQGHGDLFEDVYTDLHVTEGGHAAVNSEHEYRQFPELKEEGRGTKAMLSSKDIFDPDMVKKKHVRTIIMKGSPGIGKSTFVQKFIHDWVEGRAHQDIFFLIPMSFKELNQMDESRRQMGEDLNQIKEGSIQTQVDQNEREDDEKSMEEEEEEQMEDDDEKGYAKLNLLDLICKFYPEMKDVDNLDFDDCQVMFILDGLDESILSIDFHNTLYYCDPAKLTTINVLITNLIRGSLLFYSYVWVISRPIKIKIIPAEYIHQLLDVRGFTDEQKDAYFRKTIRDEALAEKVLTHIKSCKTLYFMCHMPLFCWVVRNHLETDLKQLPAGTLLPKALTHFYTKFLRVQIQARDEKLLNPEFLMTLGKIAFQLLEKNVFRINREDWKTWNLEADGDVTTSGLCTQFYREKFVMYQEKVDCFIHPTLQEYLAALYAFMCFKNQQKNVLGARPKFLLREPSLADLHRCAVDKALIDKNSNYDIFLRFLLGLSVEANQEPLRDLISNRTSTHETRVQTQHYIIKKIKENSERKENLERCLDELFPQRQ